MLILLAAAGSAGLLGGAFLFQLAGYPPCAMCLWQRWPHAAAIGIGALALVLGWRWLAGFGALAALTTAGIGVYHSGVERDWWEGPTSCTGSALNAGGDLLATDGPSLVMCDVVSWQLFGLSMASWNALFSLVLVAFWLAALRRA
jgi:disulfide bond formation protein DsbB